MSYRINPLAGVAAVATEGAAIPLLLASGVLGGASAGTNAADRVNNGTFKWKSTETALDLLGIAGGIASVGGLASLTGAGRAILANGAKFTVQNLGNVTRIVQLTERGANVAGGILIANQYVSAMDEVNRSSMSPEQKANATRQIIVQAIAGGNK